jgi:hypothetical protein
LGEKESTGPQHIINVEENKYINLPAAPAFLEINSNQQLKSILISFGSEDGS